jgi:hypothetical protein
MKEIEVEVVERDGRSQPARFQVQQVLLAGYTGRDQAKVREHIHELEALGVAPPPRVPMVYVVEPELLTTGASLVVSGPETSGEAEFYLIPSDQGLLVGVGSDHTDRKHEAIDVAESKTLCPKAISRQVWRYDDLKDHWDQLEIRAWVTNNGERQLYQDGRLDAFLTVEDVLAELAKAGHADLTQRLVFGGTLATLSGFVYGQHFETQLRDPVLNRTLTCAYNIVLPAS